MSLSRLSSAGRTRSTIRFPLVLGDPTAWTLAFRLRKNPEDVYNHPLYGTPEWRNGRRARLKIWSTHVGVGSSPSSGTKLTTVGLGPLGAALVRHPVRGLS